MLFIYVSKVLNNISYKRRRHFKLFANCHVSWDTLQSAAFHYQQVKKTTFYLFFRFDTSTVSLMENKKWRAQEGIFI